MSGDVHLRDLAQDWELRINLLSESAPAVEPPAHVWEEIAQRIGPDSAPLRESWLNRLWDSLSFWRGAGALAAALPPAGRVQVALHARYGQARGGSRSKHSTGGWPASKAGSVR